MDCYAQAGPDGSEWSQQGRYSWTWRIFYRRTLKTMIQNQDRSMFWHREIWTELSSLAIKCLQNRQLKLVIVLNWFFNTFFMSSTPWLKDYFLSWSYFLSFHFAVHKPQPISCMHDQVAEIPKYISRINNTVVRKAHNFDPKNLCLIYK